MTPGEQIDQLREQGWKVRVHHSRPTHSRSDGGYEHSPSGGQTVVQVQPPDRVNTGAEGVAICSNSENFNRRLGLKIALERALTLERHPERRNKHASWIQWEEQNA